MNFQQIVDAAVLCIETHEVRREAVALMAPKANALWSEQAWDALRCTPDDPQGLSVDRIETDEVRAARKAEETQKRKAKRIRKQEDASLARLFKGCE